MDMLAVGVVRRPHGVRGFLRVHSFSGEVEHLLRLREIRLRRDGKELSFAVEASRAADGGVLVKLRGLNSPEDARKLSGWEIWVPRDQAAPLREGEHYVADLCRCALVFQGSRVGEIRSVVEAGSGSLLEAVDPGGRTFLIPFVAEHVGEVNLAEGTVELKTPWLLP